MVKRGRQPAPSALKILKGERKDRINKAEPKPLILSNYRPTVELNQAQEQIFHEYAQRLTRQRVLTENDVDMLSIYVREYCWYRYYMLLIDSEGAILENDKGNKYEHPASNLANKHLKNVLAIAPHFGFSPSTRSRITVNEDEKVNTFKQFQK